MEVNGEVAERIERRLDALGLRPEEVDAKVGLPPGTTERLRSGHGPIPGGRFLRGLCAALDTDEAYLPVGGLALDFERELDLGSTSARPASTLRYGFLRSMARVLRGGPRRAAGRSARATGFGR